MNEMLVLKGKKGNSCIVDLEKNKLRMIYRYEIFYQDNEGSEPIVANMDSSEEFAIVKSNKKTENILIKYNDRIQCVETTAMKKNEKNFDGKMLLTWQEKESDSEINLLWVDGKNQEYKTIAFSCYGYPIKKMMQLFIQLLRSVNDDYRQFLLPGESYVEKLPLE